MRWRMILKVGAVGMVVDRTQTTVGRQCTSWTTARTGRGTWPATRRIAQTVSEATLLLPQMNTGSDGCLVDLDTSAHCWAAAGVGSRTKDSRRDLDVGVVEVGKVATRMKQTSHPADRCSEGLMNDVHSPLRHRLMTVSQMSMKYRPAIPGARIELASQHILTFLVPSIAYMNDLISHMTPLPCVTCSKANVHPDYRSEHDPLAPFFHETCCCCFRTRRAPSRGIAAPSPPSPCWIAFIASDLLHSRYLSSLLF